MNADVLSIILECLEPMDYIKNALIPSFNEAYNELFSVEDMAAAYKYMERQKNHVHSMLSAGMSINLKTGSIKPGHISVVADRTTVTLYGQYGPWTTTCDFMSHHWRDCYPDEKYAKIIEFARILHGNTYNKHDHYGLIMSGQNYLLASVDIAKDPHTFNFVISGDEVEYVGCYKSGQCLDRNGNNSEDLDRLFCRPLCRYWHIIDGLKPDEKRHPGP